METELLRRELAETESELQIYETTPRLLHSVAGNFACTISFLPFRPIPTETRSGSASIPTYHQAWWTPHSTVQSPVLRSFNENCYEGARSAPWIQMRSTVRRGNACTACYRLSAGCRRQKWKSYARSRLPFLPSREDRWREKRSDAVLIVTERNGSVIKESPGFKNVRKECTGEINALVLRYLISGWNFSVRGPAQKSGREKL